MSFALDVFASVSTKKTAADNETVYITIKSKPVEFIKDLRVRATNNGCHLRAH
jgi:hypothetical protein